MHTPAAYFFAAEIRGSLFWRKAYVSIFTFHAVLRLLSLTSKRGPPIIEGGDSPPHKG